MTRSSGTFKTTDGGANWKAAGLSGGFSRGLPNYVTALQSIRRVPGRFTPERARRVPESERWRRLDCSQ
jgi:hypothetical protein